MKNGGWIAVVVSLGALGITCSVVETPQGPSASGGSLATGGTRPQGGSTGGIAAGGAATGGLATGGFATGGVATGGLSSGGVTTGGTATGGMLGQGAATTGGSSESGGTAGGAGGADAGGAAGASGGSAGTNGGLMPGNPPVLSAGCGKATTVTTGKRTIMSSGRARSYLIDIPAGYDTNKPHRLFYTSHWIGGTAEEVRNQNFYFLKPLAAAGGVAAIFVAPQALPGNPGGTWSTDDKIDHVLFDDLLAFAKENLCIDTTRVFATGFSFGGMMTYSLSVNHQREIRAAVGIAPTNYNIFVPPKTGLPIAWMQTTGMRDGLCPWVQGNSTTNGAKWVAMEHAKGSGCTLPADIPTWKSGGHTCYDFAGCKEGYPVKACTFDGDHTNIASDPGSNENWIANDSWKFFMQF